jgi:hypothetical protein
MKKILFIIALFVSIGMRAQDTLTTEQKQTAKTALFDSYNVVVAINALGAPTAQQVAEKARNVWHLQIMLAKDWMLELLTENEENQIRTILN